MLVTLTKASDQPITFQIALNFISASAADISITGPTSVTVPANSLSSTVPLVIDASTDSLVEAAETLTVTATSYTPTFTPVITYAAFPTLTINSLDSVSLSFTTTPVTKFENADGGSQTAYRFDVVSNNAAQGPFTVSFTTADDTAVSSSDYTLTNGALSFAGNAGETKSIFVLVTNDNLVEAT